MAGPALALAAPRLLPHCLFLCFAAALPGLAAGLLAKGLPALCPAALSSPFHSHLQKYRLSEGVTCVPHGARGHAAGLRRLQQQLPPLPAIGLSTGGSIDGDLAAPAAKRARGSPTAMASPGLMAASSGVWPLPALPSGGESLPAFLSGLGASSGTLPEAAVPVLLPQPVGLPLPPLPLPGVSPPAAPDPQQPEGIEKLLELAELAAAQYDELQSLELGGASQLDSISQQLAAGAAAAAAAPPQQQQEVAGRVAALQEQQAQLSAALAAHAQQHAHLAEQLADLRRSAAELLSGLAPHALTPAQLQKMQQQQQQQQQDAATQPVKSEPSPELSQVEQPAAQPLASSPGGRMATASAVLQEVAPMATAAARSGPNAAEAAASAPPHIASLLALITSAASSAPGPASAHLQQLMQHASLLSAPRPLA